jgi:hypothetical protein
MVLGETQIKALEWLTSGRSITEAAQFADVARQTAGGQPPAERGRGFPRHLRRLLDQIAPPAESAVATLTHAIRDRRDVRGAQFVIKHLSAAAKRK